MAKDTSVNSNVIDHVVIDNGEANWIPGPLNFGNVKHRVTYSFYDSNGKLVNDMDVIKDYMATHYEDANYRYGEKAFQNGDYVSIITKEANDSIGGRLFNDGRQNYVVNDSFYSQLDDIKNGTTTVLPGAGKNITPVNSPSETVITNSSTEGGIASYTVDDDLTSLGSGGGGTQTYTFYDSNGNIITDEQEIAEYITNHPEIGIDFNNPFVQVKINDGSFLGNKVNEGRVAALVGDAAAATGSTEADLPDNGGNTPNNPADTPKGETPKTETPKDETPKDETPKDESDGETENSPRDWTTFTKMYEGENAPNNEPATPAFSGAVTDSESVRIYKVKTFINGFTPPGEYGEEQLIKMLYAKFVSPSCSTLFNNFQNTMKETIEGVIVPTLDDVMNTLNATNSNQYMSTGDGDAVTNGERLKTAKTNIEAFKTHMLSLTQEEFANTLNTYNEKFKEGKKKTRVYLLKKQANEVINPEERPTGEENLEGIVWLKKSSPPAEYKGEQINDFKRKKYWFEGPVDSFENPDTGEITYAYKKINRPIYYIAPEVIESALDSGENHERLESAELNCPQRTKYDPGSVVMEVGM